MADYNKQTVANLRQLLKDRAIPSKGLTRKAQIVEKLEEYDKASNDRTLSETAEGEKTAGEKAPTSVHMEEQSADESDADAERPHVLVNPQVVTEPAAHDELAPTGPPTAAQDVPMSLAPADATEADSSTIDRPHDAPDNAPVATKPNTAADTSEPTNASIPQSTPMAADTAMVDRTPSPNQDEKPTVEEPEVPIVREQSATSTAELSRLNTEELEADSKKRKRRSLSPSVPSQDVQAKKAKPNDVAPEVHLKEDEDMDTVMEQRQPEDEQKHTDQKIAHAGPNSIKQSESKLATAEQDSVQDKTASSAPEPEKDAEMSKKEKDPRYRELLKPESEIVSKEFVLDEPFKVSALHEATPALYIRNLMRPLKPNDFQAHLIKLAFAPETETDPTIIKKLFLDNWKTHAFVIFTSTNFASRVRSSLHGVTYPHEANRKELWVDFVPESKAKEWIEEEESANAAEQASRPGGRPMPAKKFEVVYSTEDGTVIATLQEVGASAPVWDPPKGPRTSSQQVSRKGSMAVPTRETRQDIEKSFKTLEQLFLTTTTKPQLYYLPVPDDISKERLRDLDRETSRDWAPEETRRGRGMQRSRLDEKVRFGFDDENRVIEVGPDFGPWSEHVGGGFRGGRRGGRGFGRLGGWRSGP